MSLVALFMMLYESFCNVGVQLKKILAQSSREHIVPIDELVHA